MRECFSVVPSLLFTLNTAVFVRAELSYFSMKVNVSEARKNGKGNDLFIAITFMVVGILMRVYRYFE